MRELLIRIGVYGFVSAVIATLGISMVIGYEMIVWPTIILTYPALICIGVAVGLSDFVELFRYLRAGRPGNNAIGSVLFILGRGSVFMGILVVFLFLEISLIVETLQDS